MEHKEKILSYTERKKVSKIILSVMLIVSITAAIGCAKPEVSNTNSNSTANASQNNEQTTIEPIATPISEPTVVSKEPASAGVLGDFQIEIGDATMGKDYEGKDAIIITYKWSHSADEAKNFMFAFSDKAFQGGIQLETAIMVEGVDSSASMLDIKAGVTLEVKEAYLLRDTTTLVEIEVSELISFSKEMVAKSFDLPC